MKRIIEEDELSISLSRASGLTMRQRQIGQALQIKTILVPLDFSRASIQALKYTIPLAKEFGATIHLVCVRPVDEVTAIENTGGFLLNRPDAIALMQDRLSEALRKQGGFSPDNCHVAAGRPFEEICKVAGRIGASLIVLPTRGLGRLKHIFLGSTAERVVRHAPCPVLIPHGAGFKSITWNGNTGLNGLKLRKILVPVDFSPCSLASARYAARLARTTGGTLRLFHIIFPYTQLFPTDRVGADLRPLSTTAKVTAREQMERLTGMTFLRDLSCEIQIRTGSVIGEIVGESSVPGIDLIVTSTHGRGGFKRAVIGSVAEHVVRYAQCPVLTVPSRGCP